jgi:ribonuclease T1
MRLGKKVGLILVLTFSVVFIVAQARNNNSHHPAQATSNESSQTSAREDVAGDSILVAQLPPEGRDTLQLIKRGGPFPYPRDGVVFSNFERALPQQSRGYYHEYTVKTPGVSHRGARRVVCGELPECYYTADHYKSFQRILEAR